MIKIFIRNVTSQLTEYTAELKELLSCYYENYWFMPQVKCGVHTGKFHFLKFPSLKFPTGLLFIVTEYYEKNNVEYELVDYRLSTGEIKLTAYWLDENLLSGIKMRDYQLAAINRALGEHRGVLELPTGSGKTEIAIGICKCLTERGNAHQRDKRVLYLVHTKDLLHQTADRFKQRLGIEVGKIGDSIFELGDKVTIATVQSVDSLMKKALPTAKDLLNSFDILFLDECHHSSASTWYKVGMFMHNAYYRFGMSGTPLRRDKLSNMRVMALSGQPIYQLTTAELIADGTLSRIEIKILPNQEDVHGDNWQEVYRKGIVDSIPRNASIAARAFEEWENKKRVMILVRQIAHGHTLHKQISENHNIPVIFLYGKTTSKEREAIKKQFHEVGDFILIASTIFDEGIDLPEINVLIVAAGGKSEVKTIQRIGRGLRKKSDDSSLTVYDYMDSSRYLKKHSRARVRVYKSEGFL